MFRVLIAMSLVVGWQLRAVELPPGFVAETLATNLNAATAIAPAPDGRIFIADQTGHLLVWKDSELLPTPALTLHVTDYWERGLIGVTLHPDFPRTPHLFVLYVTDKPFVQHVLSRFTLNGDTIDPASERVLLEGDDQAKLGGTIPAGHQGGPVRFGPDGKLYVGLGEQTAGEPAQRLDTLQGKILRLNPDASIPEDNPFFATAQGEYRAIFAYGIRNPFGLATQPETKRMFFTDVGGTAFEEVNELIPGANYGWPRAEGFSTNSAYKQPLHAYSPLVGQSIVGGVFLPRSSAWPEKWRGKFFFADFMKHWIKALDPDSPTNVATFAHGLNGPVATEIAPDGSLLVLNRAAIWRDPKKFVTNAGSLLRIRYAPDLSVGRASPPDEVRPTFTPALGLPTDSAQLRRTITRADWDNRLRRARRWPFLLNNQAWHPFAREQIGIYLPDAANAKLLEINGEIQLPPGAVVVRDFSITKGNEPRLIERRLLVVGHPRAYGASYRWNTSVSRRGPAAAAGPESAQLVEDGYLETFGRQAWWFPGVDDAPLTNPAYWLSTAVKGARWQDARAPAEARVRSYLHANCAVCHQPGGASRGQFDARITTPLDQTGIINGPLAAGDLGISGAKIVVPGDPDKSILYRRLKATDFFRMPPVQYHNEPPPILPILERWIRSLPATTTATN